MLVKIGRFFEKGIEFFVSPPSEKYRFVSVVWLVLLCLGGNLLWAYFLNWGHEPYMYRDWSEITGPRLTFLENAMKEGVLPLHAGNFGPFTGDSTRFMATADVVVSPQVILLRFMDQGMFITLDTCLLFTLGYLGLLYLRRKQKLSILATTIAFFLFFFSGHILAHYSVGHFSWGGYFLLPWYVALLLDLFAGRGGWGWILKMASLLFIILLQGSYHQFAWLLCFLLMLALARPKYFSVLIRGILFSVLASLFRLLPSVLNINHLPDKFLGGYQDLWQVLASLVQIQRPGMDVNDLWTTITVGQWEFTLYVGIVGAVFLLFFGVYRAIRDRSDPLELRWLLIPCMGMIFLSLSRVYNYIFKWLPVPPFNGERIVSRMASLAFVIVIFLAVIQFQKWLDARKINPFEMTLMLGCLVYGVFELMVNYQSWTMNMAYQVFGFFGYTKTQWFVKNNYTDTPYIATLVIGLAVSAATLVVLGILARREKLHAGTSAAPALKE